jgi:hypothetical protein
MRSHRKNWVGLNRGFAWGFIKSARRWAGRYIDQQTGHGVARGGMVGLA